MNSSSPILEMKQICKYFSGVTALSNVDFSVKKGEIHALMGENGAGKSTLIKVLTGVHPLDVGIIKLKDTPIHPKSPKDAQNIGISTVYQEVNLCSNLSVAENIYIGRQPKKRKQIDWNMINNKALKLLEERLNLSIDVTQPLSSYSIAIQQMIAIARAIDISCDILILDEPTSSLDSNEVQELFKIMRKLKNEGISIIFITHFLDQVYAVSDQITVLRNGELVGTFQTEKLSRLELIAKMIGKEFEEIQTDEKKPSIERTSIAPFIHAENLGKKGTIPPFNLKIFKGEILGLAGLLGSGRSETAKLLFGIDKADSGILYIDGEKMRSFYPKKAIQKGLALCPEERKVEGIIAELNIRENIVLALQASRKGFKAIPLQEQQTITEKYIKLLGIKTPSSEQRIDKLSGGNQQKVVLARWLATNPKLLILDEPTRGIDVGSRTEIQKLILSLAENGMTILLISSELEELVKCCDRIIVLRDRRQIGELTEAEISEHTIMKTIATGGGKNVV